MIQSSVGISDSFDMMISPYNYSWRFQQIQMDQKRNDVSGYYMEFSIKKKEPLIGKLDDCD